MNHLDYPKWKKVALYWELTKDPARVICKKFKISHSLVQKIISEYCKNQGMEDLTL